MHMYKGIIYLSIYLCKVITKHSIRYYELKCLAN